MDDLSRITFDLLIVLTAGLIAVATCKRIGVSLLVGYLVVGALIGQGVLGIVSQQNHELEILASAGALFLLFAVGIEFSLDELARLSRYFLVGGLTQMLLVAVPLSVACLAYGFTANVAILIGAAGALSSTVLVFKALSEWGQTTTPHGKRAIAILLFQDVALVPLMLLLPLLTHQGEAPTIGIYGLLAGKSLTFVVAIYLLRRLVASMLVALLVKLRSVELVILFTLCLLGGVCWGAVWLGLPAAVGALAAGMILSGNRLSKQIDTVVLPFRESFSAVFFVTLGTLFDPAVFFREPLLLSALLVGMLLVKGIAAAISLRLTGLKWKPSIGMGFGLAQLGEFSFLLLAGGVSQGLVSASQYNRMLFIALGTLILTPQLLKFGLQWTDRLAIEHDRDTSVVVDDKDSKQAVVIGLGVIGRQTASRLETTGLHVCLMDISPINLYAFAQHGFHTVTGDARDVMVLRRANVQDCALAVVTVPDDNAARQIVTAIRLINTKASILVRCRYLGNVPRMKKAGANGVISEEAEASQALMKWCEQFMAK
ncbi:Inner membrane protein YbaL [Planctomycetes bacterium CA13]|uniref:Inner membrane protein YbaL n=1 Tax=Novipirellula herctigrandis TaxID=2527986 RepID=A0A5C5Z631_9BACT|nr:Inner membrane protein YbaL [Planctomycetes bacterium CA13]